LRAPTRTSDHVGIEHSMTLSPRSPGAERTHRAVALTTGVGTTTLGAAGPASNPHPAGKAESPWSEAEFVAPAATCRRVVQNEPTARPPRRGTNRTGPWREWAELADDRPRRETKRRRSRHVFSPNEPKLGENGKSLRTELRRLGAGPMPVASARNEATSGSTERTHGGLGRRGNFDRPTPTARNEATSSLGPGSTERTHGIMGILGNSCGFEESARNEARRRGLIRFRSRCGGDPVLGPLADSAAEAAEPA
jgi:hypothetical protein